MSIPYQDLSTVRGCIEKYGGPIEQREISTHGYPYPGVHPFDLRESLENSAFTCDDVAVEVLLKELTSGTAMQGQRKEGRLVIQMVHASLLEDCGYHSDPKPDFGEVLYLFRRSMETPVVQDD